MDAFDLDETVIGRYKAFARSFTNIRSPELNAKVDELYATKRFWPEPLVQLNPHYAGGGSIQDFIDAGDLEPECADVFRDLLASGSPRDRTLRLRKHQQQAIGYALNNQSYAVTTGTGSGKSLCFFIPIIDAAIKARKAGQAPGTRAIVIYPMNALANSQAEELRRYLGVGNPHTPTFARYTGQEGPDERERVKDDPPDILLTNFMMLELLMTRQNDLDRKVIENCRGLRFVVLDELHTYRGRQGADVAMLMRRLKARIGDPKASADLRRHVRDHGKRRRPGREARRFFRLLPFERADPLHDERRVHCEQLSRLDDRLLWKSALGKVGVGELDCVRVIRDM